MKLIELHHRLPPNQIGKYGQLQEWLEDRDRPTEQHRHCSHLWALYPGDEITKLHTPAMAAAELSSTLSVMGTGAWARSIGVSSSPERASTP
jgi:alpha-L-fucosidase 2